MLSFTEIADVFSNMYRVKYDASGSNLAGKVTRVTLTLRRIMEQNNIGYGLLYRYGTSTDQWRFLIRTTRRRARGTGYRMRL